MKRVSKRPKQREASGNLIVLISLSAGTFVIVCLIALSFVSLFYVHNHLQDTADSVAMFGAAKLNVHNRAGQMNSMIKRCRELVFDARMKHKACDQKFPHLSSLSRDLLEVAQLDALELDQERARLAGIMKDEANEAMQRAFKERAGGLELTLPWLKLARPEFVIEYGDLSELTSNVEDIQGIPELSKLDSASGTLTPISRHYKGHINAVLPGEDGNIPFRISALPPVVEGHASMIHLSPESRFVAFKETDSQLPSSCRIRLRVDVSGNRLPGTAESAMAVTAVAVTGGAFNYE